MKRIFASSIVALLFVFSQGCAGLISTAFAADQEFDQQIIMNVPPTMDLHVVTKEYVDEIVDEAEFPVTDTAAPIYWKEPRTIAISPATAATATAPGAAGSVVYAPDNAAASVRNQAVTPAGLATLEERLAAVEENQGWRPTFITEILAANVSTTPGTTKISPVVIGKPFLITIYNTTGAQFNTGFSGYITSGAQVRPLALGHDANGAASSSSMIVIPTDTTISFWRFSYRANTMLQFYQ